MWDSHILSTSQNRCRRHVFSCIALFVGLSSGSVRPVAMVLLKLSQFTLSDVLVAMWSDV